MTRQPPAQAFSNADYDTLRLDNQLCHALYAAANNITRLYATLLEPLGVTYPQYLVLMALWERSPRSQGDIGEAVSLESGTLTPLVKRMEAAGLVSRRRDPEDERRMLVSLTPEGERLKDAAVGVRRQVVCDLPLAPDELVDMRDALKAFNRDMRRGAA